jgi:hypothetical protein
MTQPALTFEHAIVRLGLLQESGADDDTIRQATADLYRVAPAWFIDAAIQHAAQHTGMAAADVVAWLEAGTEPGGAMVH